MRILRILFILIFFNSLSSYSQIWPKIYGGDTYNWCNGLIESYDRGYIINVQVDPGLSVPQMYAWLIKTDINGNQLWSKTISSTSYQLAFSGIENTSDGGCIVTGATTKLDAQNFDILFIKFNSCGEKEWCKIISTPGNDDYGIKIKQISDGYIALISYFQDWTTKRIWLFKLGFDGTILWETLINQSNTYLQNADACGLLVTESRDFLVTGDAYDGSPGLYILRPLIIRTDSNANVQWTLPFGHTNGFRGDVANFPQENQSGFFYMAARHFRYSVPYGDSPCFLKVSSTGLEVYYKDLISNSIYGGSSTLNLKNNDSLFISAAWTDTNNIENIGIFKSDTLGNITKTKILFQNILYSINSTLFSYDEKYLAAGNFNPSTPATKIYLFKFDSNLEYAPLNTQPRIYDSLCPHPIVSDTTSLDGCLVISDIQDPIIHPEKCKLVIFPNPAKDRVTVQLPQYLERQSTVGSTNVTTIYRQWQSTTLEVYSLDGRLVFKQDIPKSQSQMEFDVSPWQRGMYYFRLMYNGQMAAGEKVMLQ
jgi:hypothetical protein